MNTNSEIWTITDFQQNSGIAVGGMTGSIRVMDRKGNYHQLKSPISKQPLSRQVKAKVINKTKHGENTREVIASMLPPKGLGPKVRFVYDEDNKNLFIASQYITNCKGTIRSCLNDIQQCKNRHYAIVSGEDGPNGKTVGIDSAFLQPLKKDIANGVALSIFRGDHDCNPGNWIIFTENGVERTERIDFGHAFYDLINTKSIFGGTFICNNMVMDFFNRQYVGGIPTIPSKFANFRGILHTKEMVSALYEMSKYASPENIDTSIAQVKQLFLELKNMMVDNEDYEGVREVNEALQEIYINLYYLQHGFSPKTSPTVEECFGLLRNYLLNIGKQAEEAAGIIQLQIDIDKFLQDSIPNDKALDAALKSFETRYKNLTDTYKHPPTWARTEQQIAACKPPFQTDSVYAYITQRQEELNAIKKDTDSKKESKDDSQLQQVEEKTSSQQLLETKENSPSRSQDIESRDSYSSYNKKIEGAKKEICKTVHDELYMGLLPLKDKDKEIWKKILNYLDNIIGSEKSKKTEEITPDEIKTITKSRIGESIRKIVTRDKKFLGLSDFLTYISVKGNATSQQDQQDTQFSAFLSQLTKNVKPEEQQVQQVSKTERQLLAAVDLAVTKRIEAIETDLNSTSKLFSLFTTSKEALRKEKTLCQQLSGIIRKAKGEQHSIDSCQAFFDDTSYFRHTTIGNTIRSIIQDYKFKEVKDFLTYLEKKTSTDSVITYNK